jgi:predicted O-methyltransferase YrrM
VNIDCFFKRFADVLFNDKNDHIFETLKIIVGGTTSPRIAKLLNFAVSQMDDSECYLEVGVFAGGTLCSANHLNIKKAVGIDKYDGYEISRMTSLPPAQIKARCLHNIQSLGQATTRLIEKDFKDVTQEEIGAPVAVSFIDGTHNYEEVTDNLKWLEPLLANQAILVFDDVNYLEVSRAIFDWFLTHQEHYDLLAYAKPFYQDSRYMSSLNERFLNNGVCVLRYRAKSEYAAWITPEPRGEN